MCLIISIEGDTTLDDDPIAIGSHSDVSLTGSDTSSMSMKETDISSISTASLDTTMESGNI